MASHTPVTPAPPLDLAMAIIASSSAPLLLLDTGLNVVAASDSFCRAFEIDAVTVRGKSVAALGAGEWSDPRVRSLLTSTLAGHATIDAYEFELHRPDRDVRYLCLYAQLLAYDDTANARLLLTIKDITESRRSDRVKDDLLREKALLLDEVQHRVANSLQIIASVLMQSARNVKSDEIRLHLQDAHSRVMSVAAVQRQLAVSKVGDVPLRTYFTQLCQSIAASMISDHERLSLNVTGDESVGSADTSVSLGLIVTELVINSLKHAFPDQPKGRITVDYRSTGVDWTLAVGDDGVGMPPVRKDARAGLGTTIVSALARQLHAVVEVTDGRPGTMVRVEHNRASEKAADARPDEFAV